MLKRKLFILPILVFLLAPYLVDAGPVYRGEVDLDTPGTSKTLNLPEVAGKSHVIYLGETFDEQSGLVVEGYAFTHKDNEVKPEGKGKPNKPSDGPSCYTYLAGGAKWKTIENWILNPYTSPDVTPGDIYTAMLNSIDTWEGAANANIIGDVSISSTTLVADEVSTDGLNEVYFGNLEPGTIGVTIVWGVFKGAPRNRQLVEWDQVYNNYYDWSAGIETGKMNFENIAIHELGHTVGLGDVYEPACSNVTMFGIADYAEVNKISLETDDIFGIASLY